MKTCIACSELKEMRFFYKNKTTGASASRCMECYRAQVLERYHKVIRPMTIEAKTRQGARLYGVTTNDSSKGTATTNGRAKEKKTVSELHGASPARSS